MTNVTVTGAGTIDGNGAWWWQRHRAPGVEQYTRGHLIEFMWSTDLEISYLHLRNSPFWTVHPVYCKGMRAHRSPYRVRLNKGYWYGRVAFACLQSFWCTLIQTLMHLQLLL